MVLQHPLSTFTYVEIIMYASQIENMMSYLESLSAFLVVQNASVNISGVLQEPLSSQVLD